jgi:hypothetical protein
VAALRTHPQSTKRAKQLRKKPGKPIPQLPRRSRSQQRAEDQTQIERADMNQQALQNILMPSQMRASHSSGVVAVRKAPFDQLASLP